jgi:hypothetical protein
MRYKKLNIIDFCFILGIQIIAFVQEVRIESIT